MLLRSAVERQLEIIGEAMTALPRVDPDLGARLPDLSAAAGLRNMLAHAYFAIDDRLVWNIATNNVPALAVVMANLQLDCGDPGFVSLE